MSVASAVAFIRAVRGDAAMRARVAAMPRATAADYCASEPGFAFTQDELARAFQFDWAARWLHFQSKGRQGRPA
jgi:predicted ribosomally synthesized peptide with nif11-like leader